MSDWQDPNYRAFYFQRANAKRRRIKWRLTFEQWLAIWTASGKLAQRGRAVGKYCMARFKDRGPYAIGNVEIITFSRNNHDANDKRVRTERNRRNIAKGIRAYWASLTNEQRAERGRQISEAQIASGSHKRAWENPGRRKKLSQRSKQWWANMTVAEREALGQKISEGKQHGGDRIRAVAGDD